MKKTFRKISSAMVLLTVGFAVYSHSHQMKVVAVCRDVRKHMDGTYSAVIKSGGIQSQTMVSLYRLTNLRNKPVASFQVEKKEDHFISDIFDLSISQNPDKKKEFFPAKFMYLEGTQKVQAKMGCTFSRGG